jgi:hypothetical protein
MSELEGRAGPIIIGLVNKTRKYVTAAEALTLASWATKTSMLLGHTGVKSALHYEPHEYAHMRAHLQPPPGTVVGLGRAAPNRYGMFFFGSSPRIDAAGAYRIEAHRFTMAIREVVLQIVTLRGKHNGQLLPPSMKRPDKGTHLGPGLEYLWPWPMNTISVRWPTSPAFLTRDQMTAHIRRFDLPDFS